MNFNRLPNRNPFLDVITEADLVYSNFKDKDLVAVLFHESKIIAGYLMFLSELGTDYPILINLKGEAIDLKDVYGISHISTVPFTNLTKDTTSTQRLEYVTFKYFNMNNSPCSSWTLNEVLDGIKKEYGDIQFKYKIVNKHIYFKIGL